MSTVSRSRRAGLLATVAVTAIMLAPAAAQAVGTRSQGAAVGDPAALVDPMVGTGSGGVVVGQVDMFPGADMPFGMIQWSPDTTSRPDGGGYSYTDSSISGFSLTHLSGPGCQVAGDFPVLPLSGALPCTSPPGFAARSPRPAPGAARARPTWCASPAVPPSPSTARRYPPGMTRRGAPASRAAASWPGAGSRSATPARTSACRSPSPT